jgi:hypothetical protein
MDAVIWQLKKEGYRILEKDVRHIWLTRFEHINVYRKYSFDIDQNFALNGLRLLRYALTFP